MSWSADVNEALGVLCALHHVHKKRKARGYVFQPASKCKVVSVSLPPPPRRKKGRRRLTKEEKRQRRLAAKKLLPPKERKRKASLPHVVQRPVMGVFQSLLHELSIDEEEPGQPKQFLRMTAGSFDELLKLVKPAIAKQSTNFKESISSEERLAVTLLYLAQGGTYTSIFKHFHIPESTQSYVIPSVCEAIYSVLKDEYLKLPSSDGEWRLIQQDFLNESDFPQCIGAIAGKHVAIHCPPRSGTRYLNHLRFNSIVLFGIVDASYRFLYFEVGCEGREVDTSIWDRSLFKDQLETGQLGAPPPQGTPDSNIQVPSLVVADSAFTLSPYVMKPYPGNYTTWEQRVFNYRLSRATRVAENAFGLLASRFGVYKTPLKLAPGKVKQVIQATLALHNFLRVQKDHRYCGPGDVDTEQPDTHQVLPGAWRRDQHHHLHGLQRDDDGDASNFNGRMVQDGLKDYFVGPGSVPWQTQFVPWHTQFV